MCTEYRGLKSGTVPGSKSLLKCSISNNMNSGTIPLSHLSKNYIWYHINASVGPKNNCVDTRKFIRPADNIKITSKLKIDLTGKLTSITMIVLI